MTTVDGVSRSLLAQDYLAFDRASVRTKDKDGRLHLEVSNISKANVCPYLGREIPGWEELGLDPDKTYQMLRDPEELAKAAPTFNRLPILIVHKPTSAQAPQREYIGGTTGSDAKFEAPYLKNSLAFWTQDAINDIENEDKKELSSGYHYRPDMTPGVHDGVPYDGVMRDIVGNHVALVKEGRAGPDVVVGDSMENFNMAKTVLTRKAALLQGAVLAYLKPKLAQDAQIDLAPAFKGVGPKNLAAKKAGIVAAITTAAKDKLAADASLDDLTSLLDSLENVDIAEGKDEDVPPPAEPEDPAMDDDVLAKAKELVGGKLSDEELAALCKLLSAKPAAEDEDPEKEPKEPKPVAQDDPPPFEGEPKVSKGAMDAAIAAAVKDATDKAAKAQAAIREAERVVRPYVGELAIACDSADAVYATALKAMSVDISGVHPSAYPAILKAQPLPGATTGKKPTIAQDAATAKSFADRFPEAARINSLA